MSAKHLATVRDITGKIIHLGMFESVKDLRVESDLLVLAVNRARYQATRDGGYRITERGVTLYSFRRDERSDTWSLAGTVPVWWSTDEVHGGREVVRDEEWEKMCYRPGNKRNPLDGPLARTQARKNGFRGDARRLRD